MVEGVRIYPRHARMCGFCLSGVRVWVESNGFDWREFVRDGVDASRVVKINDLLSAMVIEQAVKEMKNGKR